MSGARRQEESLLAFMQRWEPVVDARLRECGGGCGRQVSVDIAVCVRCRNTSAHPALRGRVAR